MYPDDALLVINLSELLKENGFRIWESCLRERFEHACFDLLKSTPPKSELNDWMEIEIACGDRNEELKNSIWARKTDVWEYLR